MEYTARTIIGPFGAMISWSKSTYVSEHPDHKVIFNSNVCIFDESAQIGKCIWQGDLDVTLSKNKLQKLADELSTKIYVLYEGDARFENQAKPCLQKAAFVFEPVSGGG
jgi:hypothetical protein